MFLLMFASESLFFLLHGRQTFGLQICRPEMSRLGKTNSTCGILNRWTPPIIHWIVEGDIYQKNMWMSRHICRFPAGFGPVSCVRRMRSFLDTRTAMPTAHAEQLGDRR